MAKPTIDTYYLTMKKVNGVYTARQVYKDSDGNWFFSDAATDLAGDKSKIETIVEKVIKKLEE